MVLVPWGRDRPSVSRTCRGVQGGRGIRGKLLSGVRLAELLRPSWKRLSTGSRCSDIRNGCKAGIPVSGASSLPAIGDASECC